MAVYAISDMHGCKEVYYRVKEIIKPKDIIYCLGDCGDRGPAPWETIKLVATDPQYIYIKGNHEDMLVKAAREVMSDSWECEQQRLLAANGGSNTLMELLGEEKTDVWLSMLSKLPTYTIYENKNGNKIFLCHAGCTFWANKKSVIPSDKDLVWDRLHYYDDASLMNDTIIVHGHTPIVHLVYDINVEEPDNWEALKYANGKKYCIDAGTVFSGHSILLNLDTFESIDINLYD